MSIELVILSNHLILCCPISSCLQFFPASEYFPMSRLFTSGGQSIAASASASVLPLNLQGWFPSGFPLGLTGLISLQSKGLPLLQHHRPKTSVFQCSTFFMVQLSHPYKTTGKTTALTRWIFVGKVISLLFNTLSRFVLEKAMATHPSVLAWRIPGAGSLVGCCLWGYTELDTTEVT